MTTSDTAAATDVRTRPTGRTTGRRRPRLWLVAVFVGLCVAGGSWAIASPLFSVPDEASHLIYAAGAVRGEIGDGYQDPKTPGVTIVDIPSTYSGINKSRCYFFKNNVAASCDPGLVPVAGDSDAPTSAGLYPPGYYFLAGIPTLFGTNGAATVFACRLVTVLITAGLLTWGFALAADRRRGRWANLGLLVAVTPMVVYFSGSVNPQSVEIAAACVCWVAALRAFRDPDPVDGEGVIAKDPSLLPLGIAGLILCVVRPLSPLWMLILLIVTAVAVLRLGRVRTLLRRPSTWVATGLIVLGVAFNGLWTLTVQQLQSVADGRSSLELWRISASKTGDEVLHMVGTFGTLDNNAPRLTFMIWMAVLGLLIAVVVAGGRRRRLVLALGLLLVAVLVVPRVLEINAANAANTASLAWQGRYTLPIAVGLPLLAVEMVPSWGRASERRVLRWTAVALWIAQLVAFFGALSRFAVGQPGILGIDPESWSPPLPPWLLLSTFAVGYAIVVAAALLVGAPERTWDDPQPAVASAAPDPLPDDTRAPAGDPEPAAAGTAHRPVDGGTRSDLGT